MRKAPPKKTIGQFMKELEEQNLTLADWARERQLDLNVVYMVARGRAIGRRGKSRAVLQAMGIALPPMRSCPVERAA